MRKDSGFEVLDRIHLYVAGNEALEEIIRKYEADIKTDTLAEDITYNMQRDSYTNTTINGEGLQLDVEVIQ